ncbi:acetoacetate decarboxylase family protein [Streptomyces sp. NPDC046161]|uniref:acetoacetate decarboxylase family protein n=1 Tax=Streptomyces sp. NPDC046161 TaxID=3155132 RepID=UPI0033CC820D
MKPSKESVSPHRHSYPPAPWRMSGMMWMGLFPTLRRLPVPHSLSVLLPRHLVIAAIRYLDGDLSYSEFVVASLVRRGHRVGTFVHRIWVDSSLSQQGGRDIWGLDKQLARFDWTSRQMCMTTDSGAQVTLATHREPRATVPLVLPIGVFAPLGGHLAYALAPVHVHATPSRLSLPHWPEQLPRLTRCTSSVALEAPRFRAVIPPAHPISTL